MGAPGVGPPRPSAEGVRGGPRRALARDGEFRLRHDGHPTRDGWSNRFQGFNEIRHDVSLVVPQHPLDDALTRFPVLQLKIDSL